MFLVGIGLDMIGLVGNSDEEEVIAVQSAQTLTGLRLLMTVLPMIVLLIAFFFFRKRFLLTDDVVEENARRLKAAK